MNNKNDQKVGSYRDLLGSDFGQDEVKKYALRRYRTPDQRILHVRELRIVKQWFSFLAPGDLILDVPSGYGRMAAAFPEAGRPVAADLSMDMLRALPAFYRFRVRCSAHELPFRDNMFRAVLCLRLLHHLEAWEHAQEILTEAARVSREFVIISVYEKNLVHESWRRVKGKGSIIFVDPDDIKEMILKAGLNTLKKKRVLSFIHAQTLYLLKK